MIRRIVHLNLIALIRYDMNIKMETAAENERNYLLIILVSLNIKMEIP